MLLDGMRRAASAPPARSILTAGLLAAAAGCTSRPPEGEPQPAMQSQAPADAEVVRLDAAEATGTARQVESEVTATVAEGLQLRLWAPEQLIVDPIGLAVDDHGQVFVTRTTRTDKSELEIRAHPDWHVESMTLRSVEEKREFLRRTLAPERSDSNAWLDDMNGDGSRDWRDLTVQKESIYRIRDTNGDGVADESQLVMSGFNDEVSDVALGLMAHDGDLYVTVAPDIWRLRGAADGVVDAQESVSHGYHVHVGFGGHGLSGPTIGPDGRLWWAVGDVGLNVVDKEGKRWALPHQGAILRSELDGSNFEVYAAGLRNPHEFAFDEYGNLITVDNDGDHPGERERLVYVVDGSDSGWRINWQFGKYVDPNNNDYKPWMDEELFKPRWEGQAAYLLPPLVNYHTGPAGMVYNPGTALGEEWRDHFFVSEFTGTAARSRIHAFTLEEQGAGFGLGSEKVVVGGILTTGMEFAPDGSLMLADWVEGWSPKDRGRIWKLDAPGAAASPLRAETQRLIAENFDRTPEGRLAELLRHPDQRVRLKAQMELAERGAARPLLAAARQREHQIARLHGIWGLGQLARRDARQAAPLVALLRDADAEIRAQAAETLGDVRHARAADPLVALLDDPSARVRFFATEALGRIGHRPAVQPILRMLEANDDRDTYLRHGGAVALARIGQAEPLVALADHPSRALRIAAVVALRRLRHPGVARFLNDRDEFVVAEAARAINDDESIPAAVPALARVLEQQRFSSEPLLRRAINANLRVGTPEAARRLAAYAARQAAPEEMRVEAIAALGVHPEPSILDRVDGSPRDTVKRDPAIARAAVAELEPLLASGPDAVKVALAETIGRLDHEAAAPALLALVRGDRSPTVRVAALRSLVAMQAPNREQAVRAALADQERTVRMAALGMVNSLNLDAGITTDLLASVLGSGEYAEQQSALESLGRVRGEQANRVLQGLVRQLEAGNLPVELHLDVAEAVEASGSDELRQRMRRIQESRPADNPLLAFQDALRGGNADQGRRVVFQHAAAQCVRCHVVGPRGGGDVGPTLNGIGARLDREQLLLALVEPSARLAPGYGIVTLRLKNGETVTGTLLEESNTHVVVRAGGNDERRIAMSDVAERANAPSGMPPMGHILTRRELRDVVEFLASLR